MQVWQQHVQSLTWLLNGLAFTHRDGTAVDADAGFAEWLDVTLRLRDRRQTVYMIGNGASASMASHFAADLAKNARLHTQVFSDLSLITAISNDMGYEHVFAEPLRRRGQRGDMVVAISSSGQSPNILAAVDVADELGIAVVTLTAKNAANVLRARGDLNLYVAAETYGLAETAHAAALHWWMDLILMADGQLT
ncbi:MAG: SIS domain-containing protein [Planctomycetia bacterium]|nr:SIS domain-containing protein [Planctomycetia bacterium]